MSYKVHVQARVDEDLMNWFEENFSFATKQRFIEGCFKYLRLVVESKDLPTPETYLASAVKGIAEEIEDNKENE